MSPSALLAFRPVLIPERAIYLHPISCALLDSDFDGDQGAVHLLVTRAAKQEAAQKLTIAGHLTRDPDLIEVLCPGKDALFGISCLSLSPDGRKTVVKAIGRDLGSGEGIVTRSVIGDALRAILADSGTSAALDATQRLWHLGFEASRAEGGSLGPFVGST